MCKTHREMFIFVQSRIIVQSPSGALQMSEIRKLVVLLAFGIIVPSVIAALAGCGSSEAAVQNAASTKTAAHPQEAATTAPYAAGSSPTLILVPTVEPSPTPSPVPSADDALEFAPVNALGTSGRDGGITEVDQDNSEKGGSPPGPVRGQTYTWADGDRTLNVFLQTDLVVEKGSDGFPQDIVGVDESETSALRSAGGRSKDDTLPVFRSESGSLMTLPGGVLLALSADWSQAETNTFFSDNGIEMDRVSELSYATNGFFIETEPGFLSLDLANELAALDGVEVSSPNWGRQATKK